jgi:23S rRNA U2552 (ribose-2'-O)-methylase RlmE/FtsJ
MTSSGKPGASLRVWRDYFVNSAVFGADIDKNILFEEDRIKTFYVDQLNENSIKEMWSNINKSNFDIIFDDGLHTFEAGMTMFINSFDKLRKNGIYIIEDVNFVYLKKLAESLSKYNPEIIALNDNNIERGDNNLILIRKS